MGPDGGRDGKFHGTATCFPSATNPLAGHCVIQAKHVNTENRSCSDRDFSSLLKKEHAKIKKLIKAGVCEHYLVFTNRKYTAGADLKLIDSLKALGLKSATIIGVERINMALDDYPDICDTLPNRLDSVPFRFEPNDLIDVIHAIHSYVDDRDPGDTNGAADFSTLKLLEKNTINGLSPAYYQEIVIDRSMPHFGKVDQFLKNPRNANFAELYYDSADELKQKILLKRKDFASFDDVLVFLYEAIQRRRDSLRGKRRLISVILHHMYCNCEIGTKVVTPFSLVDEHVDA
jgi:hypothetical protein